METVGDRGGTDPQVVRIDGTALAGAADACAYARATVRSIGNIVRLARKLSTNAERACARLPVTRCTPYSSSAAVTTDTA